MVAWCRHSAQFRTARNRVNRYMPLDITPMILTFNEEENIARTICKLTWAREVLVVDSFSTDSTLAIARQFPNVQVRQRAFDSFAEQCNWGLAQIDSNWVLSLD